MVIPNIVNIFALNLNKITMDDLNRLKVVLVPFYDIFNSLFLLKNFCCTLSTFLLRYK